MSCNFIYSFNDTTLVNSNVNYNGSRLIDLIISSVTSLGAFAPGIRTAPITRSESLTASAIFSGWTLMFECRFQIGHQFDEGGLHLSQ